MTLLVALQGDLSGSADRLARELGGARRWVYLGEDSAWRIQAERGALAELERIPTGELLQQAAQRLRRPFVDWIGMLSQANASLEWWACELAAKTSYTLLYNHFSSLAAARELIGAGLAERTLVVCSTPALAEEVCALAESRALARTGVRSPGESAGRRALRSWARFAPGPLRTAPGRISERARMSLDTDPRYRRRILAERGVQPVGGFAGDDTVLLFTWVDRRNFAEDGSYRDPHLGLLPSLLRERGCRVAYVPRVLHALSFEDAVDRLLGTGETVFFPETYTRLDDLRESARLARAFAPSIPVDGKIDGVPISRLARQDVELHRSAHAVALSYDPLVRGLAGAGVRPARIVHTCEGHTWEQALAWSVRKYLPGTKVIGYENVNMSRLALSMIPAQAELGLRPLPDRIVTNGPAYARVLLEEGLPDELIRVGCALRHSYLWEEPAEPPTRRAGAVRVLAATDSAFGQAVELVEKAANASGGAGGYEVTVKCHPMLRAGSVRDSLGQAARRDNVRFSDKPISELLRSADLMLYTYSVVCYEALARGVPPVFVQAESVLDLDQLEPYEELRRQARAPEQIRRMSAEVAATDEAGLRDWRVRARAAAAEALAPQTPNCVDAFLG